ncbi:tyrosine-protein kinase-like otk isoform X2 [Triplophysa dalaica]|uniref:tyrosine-protein kinase-like otk isoform X2 n=1 Tax=Triplophysa dalaica TaxID=1582913 RepID=UPI0024DF4F0C|nr:tyrosine-protein kinase-like otk isoform X2 [Triplophysa dalaica]
MSTFKNTYFLLLVLHVYPRECFVLYKTAGEDLLIECGVSEGDVEWKFNSILIMHINGKTGSKRRGPLYSQNPSKYLATTNTLKITRLDKHDSGSYSCSHNREYTVRVVSVFVKPVTVLLQSSDAELHCNVEGDPKAKVQWLRPPDGQIHPESKQIIHLTSLTLNDDGRWTCKVENLKIDITLTVVGLQTKGTIEVHEGGDVVLPCFLTRRISLHIKDGKWEADHLPEIPSATLKNTHNTLQCMGHNTTRFLFTSGQLGTNFTIKMMKVQPSDEGIFVCTVEFDGGTKLTASTTLTVVSNNSSKKVDTSVNGQTPASEGWMTINLFDVQLWIGIAVGAISMVFIGLIVLIVIVQRRNKRIKKRAGQLRSLHQLTADNCQCYDLLPMLQRNANVTANCQCYRF